MSRPRPAPPFPRAVVAGVAAVALLAAAVTGCAPPTSTAVVVGGLQQPWDLAFTPGGNMVFTEKVGRISIRFHRSVRLLATPADARVMGEGGMMGVAVDPDFATQPADLHVLPVGRERYARRPGRALGASTPTTPR